jgi:hypothetical protein
MKPFKKKKNIIDIRLVYLGIAGLILVIGFIVITMPKGYINSRSSLVDDVRSVRADSGSQIIATMNDKKDIIAQFICPCGKCKIIIDDLKDCHCKHPGGAEAVKQFIYERIQENKYTPLQIVEMVSKKYGGRKTT